MIEHTRHKSGIGLRITTHTAGQNFGTFARVAILPGGATVYETDTYAFGFEEPAVEAARAWIARQARIMVDAEPAAP